MFTHNYYLAKRKGGYMPMPEQAILTMVYEREIMHERSSHVGSDKSMSHYFKQKD